MPISAPIPHFSEVSDGADGGLHLNVETGNVTVQQTIESKIRMSLSPTHIQVLNESHMHSVPAGSETHFKLVIVSDEFEGKPLVRRHQLVNGILAKELKENIHALSMNTLTAVEWQRRGGQTSDSPPCLGGSKADE